MSITAKIIVFSLIGVFVVGVASYVGVVFLSPKSAPLYVAHRGYSISNPDNTPLSFAAAANKDFWGIETDIRFTKDGVPVCNHDADVKYADGTTLAIKDNDYATLRAKPLLNEKTKDNVYLCPLSEYLSCCAAGNKVAVIELKYLFSDEELAVVLAAVDEGYSREKCVFIAFDYGNLTKLRALDGNLALQYLSETKNDPHFEDCLKDGVSIDVKYTVLTSRLVKKFHEKGLKVNVWTINKDRLRNRMRRYKVDYITSDVFYNN